MAVDIHKLIAAINPDVYCEPKQRKQVKAIVREGQKRGDASTFLKAAAVATLRAANTIEVESLEQMNPFDLPGERCPIERRRIVFDDLGARLEGLYFWLLDYMTDTGGWKVTKVIDSMSSSPGSNVHGDFLQQTSTVQNQTMKILEGAQRDVQSVLRLVEELKLLKQRLAWFEDSRSENISRRTEALVMLERLWREERQRIGREIGFNHQNRSQQDRLTGSRLADEESETERRRLSSLSESHSGFSSWLKTSEADLRTHLQLGKTRGRMLLDSLKLHARWLQPYLRTGNRLHQGAHAAPGLVTAFNSAFIEVTLVGQEPYPVDEDIQEGVLPKTFSKRDYQRYFSTVIVEMVFRAVPEKNPSSGYGYTGRAEVTLTSYALREDELNLLLRQLDRNAIAELMSVWGTDAAEDLLQLEAELETLLEEPKDTPIQKQSEDTNPFSALFSVFTGMFSSHEEKAGKSGANQDGELPRESAKGSVIRSQAMLRARRNCQRIYRQFKAARNGIEFESEGQP